ncbi:heme o synthase [Porifericola rhodea]|uniref:heme o synthase n=1 Tax=Porifericola rhodea TaxID=930972 RepID=UPI0026658E08|nr:heme o synthase [Porifericola rhodea]WKN30624.1 heme o synthase [Porifericola rhodea]
MLATKSTTKAGTADFSSKLKSYISLMKFRLSFLVAFSSAFGYVLASTGPLDVVKMLILSFAGFLISGASITINQIIERDLDKLMSRTKNRPLPTKQISVQEAIIFALLVGTSGLWLLLQYTNMLTAALSLFSLVAYSFMYTPLKRVGPIAVLVGAIPGALPPLLGWVAFTGQIDPEALVLFGIQFIWQFPHFWAIAWVADEDYKKAGFKLLPSGGGKDLKTAIQIMTYALFLIPLGLLPLKFGITGVDSAIIATVCGALFLFQTFRLMADCSRKSALQIMFGSFIYLPVVQIAFLLDKL